MAAGGLRAPAIAVLKAQGVDHLAQVEALGQAAWSHLFRSGLTLGDQRALVAMIAVYNERPLAMPPPPNLAYIGVSARRSTRARPRGREPTAARRVRPMRERRRSSTFSASRRLR